MMESGLTPPPRTRGRWEGPQWAFSGCRTVFRWRVETTKYRLAPEAGRKSRPVSPWAGRAPGRHDADPSPPGRRRHARESGGLFQGLKALEVVGEAGDGQEATGPGPPTGRRSPGRPMITGSDLPRDLPYTKESER